MKLTKSKLKQLIKEELRELGPPAQYEEDEQWDLEDHLREKFADAIAISLSKGLSADVVQQQFDNAFNQVTTHGRDMREP